MDDVRIYTGTLIADLLYSSARSLKERRGPLRAISQRLRNNDFAVAQVGPADRVQRVFLAVTAVSGREGLLQKRLDEAERIIFAGEFEVADLRRVITSETFHSY
ncbi:hypothetical protein CSB20_02620 [bacterium DOLZORAL124_64_63]|nr:MAG: hypothetical protein CSB20_02620 [bacterium DOLZORAL124_64_63]